MVHWLSLRIVLKKEHLALDELFLMYNIRLLLQFPTLNTYTGLLGSIPYRTYQHNPHILLPCTLCLR
jgi:hypothetical protein